MTNISASMLAALHKIARRQTCYVGNVDPGEPVVFSDYVDADLQGRTLAALWRRGLISFEVSAQLLPDGLEEIEKELTKRPGVRDFIVIDGGKQP